MDRVWVNNTEQRLTGGHHNSLGNTVVVAEDILADSSQELMSELCESYKSEGDVVRMRVSSALKRVVGLHPESMKKGLKPRPEWVMERFDWLIDDIGVNLDQPSAKWSIAQIMMYLDDMLNDEQRVRVVKLLKHNLDTEDDWIVKCNTAEALTKIVLVHNDRQLEKWLISRLELITKDSRKSVAGRGDKLLKQIKER